MSEIKFDKDIVRACLQAILSRKVSLDEAKSFIESDEARGYFMDYDDMMTRVWESYHCEYALVDFVPLETLVFRDCVMCITPKEKNTELEIELTDCKNRKEQSEYNLRRENEQLRNKLEVANARSGYYQRMLEKWCVKDE